MQRIITWILNHAPAKYQRKWMNRIVQEGYDGNHYSKDYRTQIPHNHFQIQCIDRFLSDLPTKKHPFILDIGCGDGDPFDRYLLSKGCHVTGVDTSQEQIDRARVKNPKGVFIHENFLYYHDLQHYDGVMMLYSLFHIHRDYHMEVLKKIWDLLDTNGMALITIKPEPTKGIKYRKDFCGRPMCWSNYSKDEFLYACMLLGFHCTFLGNEADHDSDESHLWILLQKGTD